MSIISHQYKKQFVCRYEKEVGIPYYSFSDFKGLKQEAYSFTNSINIEIKYFFYYYDNCRTDKIVLFLHGLGPGHTAYIREIETLAKMGYKVLTLDYMGCDSSGGDKMPSLNEPTRDVDELLNYLNLKMQIVVIGHSLGGYTAYNIINIRNELNKAVVMSGFLCPDVVLNYLMKVKVFSKAIARYEKKVEPKYFPIDNYKYIKETKDILLIIHSEDDPVVNYHAALGPIAEVKNPNIEIVTVNGRGHNPNYSDNAAKIVTDVFSKYYKMKKEEDKKALMEKQDVWAMTEQDPEIFNKIKSFIEES